MPLIFDPWPVKLSGRRGDKIMNEAAATQPRKLTDFMSINAHRSTGHRVPRRSRTAHRYGISLSLSSFLSVEVRCMDDDIASSANYCCYLLHVGNFRTSADYHYQTLRCNVDLLKMIQLGVTFADENGNVPKDACTWQFNFKFNLK